MYVGYSSTFTLILTLIRGVSPSSHPFQSGSSSLDLSSGTDISAES